jgi:hypothetical protein
MRTLTDHFKEGEKAKNDGSAKAIPDMPPAMQLLRDFAFLQGAMEIVGAVTLRIRDNPSREEFAREFEELKKHLLLRRAESITNSMEDLIRRDPVKGVRMLAELMKLGEEQGLDMKSIFEDFNKR